MMRSRNSILFMDSRFTVYLQLFSGKNVWIFENFFSAKFRDSQNFGQAFRKVYFRFASSRIRLFLILFDQGK